MIIKRIALENHLAEIRLINKLIFSCMFPSELVKHQVENTIRKSRVFFHFLNKLELLLAFIKYVTNNFNDTNIMQHTLHTRSVEFTIFLTGHFIRHIIGKHWHT